MKLLFKFLHLSVLLACVSVASYGQAILGTDGTRTDVLWDAHDDQPLHGNAHGVSA